MSTKYQIPTLYYDNKKTSMDPIINELYKLRLGDTSDVMLSTQKLKAIEKAAADKQADNRNGMEAYLT